MTETNQEHVDRDVAAIRASLTTIIAAVAELKAQPGAENLDFTALDALTADAATEATADGPAPVDAPPADPPPAVPPAEPAPVDPPA